MRFDWDEHNLFHIAMHGVTRAEVESAMLGNPIFLNAEIRNQEKRRLYLGKAANQRILSIVTTVRSSRVRIVTTFPANRADRRHYIFLRGESHMIKIDTPEFASEAEEARWWFENQDIISQAFQKEYPLPSGKTLVDLLLDEHDAQPAEAQADVHGLPRETYMAELLYRALHEQNAA